MHIPQSRGTEVLGFGAKRLLSTCVEKEQSLDVLFCFLSTSYSLSAQADIRRLRPTAQNFTHACHGITSVNEQSETLRVTEPNNPAAEPTDAVRLEQVTSRIGKRTVLDRISLTIDQGSITGILGTNGAGKTTLLNVISGLREPSAGTVTVLGESQGQRSLVLRQRIGNVFQETALHDELTAQENLRFAASLYAVPDPNQRIDEVLALLGLSLRSRERVGHLSGGLRRRVTIARALLHSPDLLLIDEPTLGVDVEARHTIWAHLRLLRSRGTTVVVSTNYLDEALALCDSVSVLRDGRVLVTADPAVLVAQAGSCLDIECGDDAVDAIITALADFDSVLRVDATPTGMSVFLDGKTSPESIVPALLKAAPIQGFRIRSADLAEVFRAWEDTAEEKTSR
ncbi:MAG: ABC transporter ATP-binding protein [Janthinobacterium lividum]